MQFKFLILWFTVHLQVIFCIIVHMWGRDTVDEPLPRSASEGAQGEASNDWRGGGTKGYIIVIGCIESPSLQESDGS